MEPFAVRLFEVFISKDRSRHGNCMPYTVSPAESKLYYVMEPFEKLNARTSTPIKNIENPVQMERTAVLEDISMGEDTPDELQATVVVPVMPEEADENMEATEDNSTLKMDDAPADDTAEYDSLDDELCWMLDQSWISRRPARSDSTLGMLSRSMLSSSDEDTPADKWPPNTPRQKRRVSFDDRPNTKGFRVFNTVTNEVIISRDVIVVEEGRCEGFGKKATKPVEFLEIVFAEGQEEPNNACNNPIDLSPPEDASHSTAEDIPSGCDQSNDTPRRSGRKLKLPSRLANEAENVSSDSEYTTPEIDSDGALTVFSHQTSGDDPNNYAEAMSSENAEDWKHAMDEELKSIEANETWSLVDLPHGR
ncbi:uncharacterized protein LOC118502389 [Anopheles stephensi]|uniref:uncharacterized protein LOC118502389 n=1 Tax=Anopheles stephensi TaxID=30069 RepID=UPI001658755B|nr:uncharacterized protein LOC118502389 [Anopheles stephensi]